MRKSFLHLLVAAALLTAAPLSRGERDRAMSELHATRKMFLDSVAGLSRAQWRFQPGPGRWSVAQVAEHVVLAEDAIYRFVTEEVLKKPAAPEKSAEQRASLDRRILKEVPDRSRKMKPRDDLKPTGKWATRRSLIEHFKKSRDRTIVFIRETEEPLRSHFASNPVFGELDAYQWILFLSAHTARHVAQINEVKADPDFPKQ